jgi:hypothetical protein
MDRHSPAWQQSKWAVWALVTSAWIWLAIRCLLVTGADGKTPFLSANDRSRWCTVVALVDQGRFSIDDIIQRPGWNTIDKVYHRGRDGQPHYYSSKPTLFPTLLAVPYAVVKAATGWSLLQRPILVGRLLIFFINGLFVWLLFGAVIGMARRYCVTRWGLVFTVAVITWGTFLTTFAVTINNHLPAAAMIAVALNHLLAIWLDGDDALHHFVIVGLTSALAASFELPALAFFAMALCGLLLFWPRKTVLGFVPPALVVAAAFFGTNFQAHGTMVPAYAHRALGEDWQTTNWYNYPGSYWLRENRKGVDRGEPSVARYALHVLAGHHGIWSLTPIWFLSVLGVGYWAQRRGGLAIGLLVVATTTACLVFYIFLRESGDRNYGGVTCGFRWAFWLIPMFVVAMVPAADRISHHAVGRRIAYALLFISIASAVYGGLHPWQHPWPYAWWA